MEATLSATPGTYWQLIGRSLRLYFGGFKGAILLSLLLSLTVFVPRLVADITGSNVLFTLPPLSWHRLWFVALDLIALLFFVAMLWHMQCVTRHQREPLAEDFKRGVKKNGVSVYRGLSASHYLDCGDFSSLFRATFIDCQWL